MKNSADYTATARLGKVSAAAASCSYSVTRRCMEYWEQASPISSHTYDHARTANALPMTTPGRLMHYL